jgi:autotransporter-associated beta strand protein
MPNDCEQIPLRRFVFMLPDCQSLVQANARCSAKWLGRYSVMLAIAFAAARAGAQTGPTWTSRGGVVYQSINSSLGVPGTSLYAEVASLSGSQSGGSNGTAFCWPLSTMMRADDSLAMLNPVQYDPILRSLSDQFYNNYWNASTGGYRSGAAFGSTLYYDDNAHVVVALAQAYQITGDPVYLTRAEQTEAFVLSGSDGAAGGGIYFTPGSTFKDTVSTLQGARGAALLYEITGQSSDLTDATQLYNWCATHTQTSNGLFYQQYQISSGSATGTPIVNSAGDGISCNIQLYKATGNASYLTEAETIANTSISAYFNSSTGAINDEGYWAFELVDALLDLYQIDHNSQYLNKVVGGMQYLYNDMQDTNGHYGTFWGRNGPITGTTLSSWDLNEQAPVARAYLYTGQALTPSSTWTLAGGGSWSSTANWTPSSVPNGDGANIYLQLESTSSSPTIITLDGRRTVGTLYLADTANTASGYNITAGTTGFMPMLTLSNTAGDDAQVILTSGSQMISAPVSLASNLVVSLSSGSSLAMAGNISGTGKSLTLAYGSGALTLSGSNTYGGGTTISAGTLTLGGTGSLGGGNYAAPIVNNSYLVIATAANQTFSGGISGSGGLFVSGGGILALAGANNYSGGTTISAGTLTVAGTGILGGGNYVAPIVDNSTLVVATSANQVLGGAISGSGSLFVSGGGMLTLNGTCNYSGATTVSGGTLQLGAAGLAHRWSFDNSLADSVGGVAAILSGSNTTLGASAVTVAGNGSSHVNYVSLGNGSGNLLPTSNAPFTVQVWATENGVQNWSRIFDFGSTAGGNSNLLWSWTQGTSSPGVVSANSVNYPNTASMALGKEYNVSLVVTPSGAGSKLQWYQYDTSGNLLGSGGTVTTWNISKLAQTNMWLGRSEYADADANASYDEVRIYKAALTQSQLAALSLAGPDARPAPLVPVLPVTTPLAIAPGGTLDLDGGSQQVASLSGGGSVVNSNMAFSSILAVSTTGVASTFSGTIQGGGGLGTVALVLSGGTEVLSGANTYTGGTTVAAGKLIVTTPAALPDGDNLIVGAAGTTAFSSAAIGAPTSFVPASAVAVPEPGSLALLTAAGIVAAASACRRKTVGGRRRILSCFSKHREFACFLQALRIRT